MCYLNTIYVLYIYYFFYLSAHLPKSKKTQVHHNWLLINTLSANPTKWSSTLKKFFGKSRRIA